MSDIMDERFVTTKQLSEYLGLNTVTIRRAVHRGDLIGYKLKNGRRILIPLNSAKEWLAEMEKVKE